MTSHSNALREMKLFHGLSSSQLAEVERAVEYVTLPAAARVMNIDEVSQAVFIILEGTVKVYAGHENEGSVMLGMAGRGEVLGEISAFDGLGHSATVMTLEPVVLVRIDSQRFMEMIRAMPLLLENLTRLIIRRLRLSTVRIHLLATGDTKCRLARLLMGLADQYHHSHADSHSCSRTEEPVEIPLRLRQADLAAMIGTARPHLNKVLQVLQHEQAISISPEQRITILKRDLLLRHCR